MDRGTVISMGNFELPDKNAAAHRVVNNAKLFRLLGFNTVFLGACRSDRYFSGYQKRGFGGEFDIYERSYPFSAKQWAAQMFDITDLRELAGRYPDTVAVILYNTPYATLCAAEKAFSRKGIRVLYDCTEWNGMTEGAIPKRAVKKIDSKLIETRLPRHCDGIVAVSRTMQTRYQGERPVLLLPPLVDIRDPIWRQEPMSKDCFTFCYAGSPSDKDRLDLLVAAFSRLPRGAAELRIVGISREEYIERYGGDGEPPSDDVSFAGRLSHEDTVREILGCGCFVFLRDATRRNTAGFPTKFVEAFTCGAPMITTAVSDVPFYADDGCEILTEASVDRICRALERALGRQRGPRPLRNTFDYRNYEDACRLWFERILCRTE